MQNYQIFISYKRDPDAPVAEKIYNELDSRGYQVFLDRIGLEGGSRFPDRIKSAIKSSELFLLLLSNATRESHWVKKEVNIAIKRAEEKSLVIVPVILDGTPQTEFKKLLTKYVFNNFTIIESDGDIGKLGRQICNLLEAQSIYPPKEVADFLEKYKETKNSIKSITKGLRELVKECANCPRRCSDSIQCPLFYPDIKPDEIMLEENRHQALARLGDIPIRESFSSDIEYEWALEDWRYEYMNIKEGEGGSENDFFIESVGGWEHLTRGNRRICGCQEDKIMNLSKKIHYLTKPLFQSDLLSVEKDINEINRSFIDEDWRILDKLGLKGILPFMSMQVSRAWEKKKDILNYLIVHEAHGSIKNLLSCHLSLASSAIRRALKTGDNIQSPDYYSFFLLWWLLRENSCYLTQSLLSQDIGTDDEILKSSVDGFIETYEKLSNSKRPIAFEIAFSIPHVDKPEEMYSHGIHYLGCYLSDYDWFYLNKKVSDVELFLDHKSVEYKETFTWISKTPRDSCCSPLALNNLSSDGVMYGLSRGSYHGGDEFFDMNPGILYAWEQDGSVEHRVHAIDCVYSLDRYCRDLRDYLAEGKIVKEFSFDTPLLKFHHFDSTDKFLYNSSVAEYNTLIYSEISPVYLDALSEIDRGNLIRGKELLESLAETDDLNAIIYLANLYAYSAKPDYAKALPLYEKAVSRGVLSCIINVAQCFELLHNFREAYWWYLLLKDDDTISQENLNLRLGNCCFHLGQDYLYFFKNAGDRGMAAIYLLDSSPDNKAQFSKALAPLINFVQPRLCDFRDLDTYIALDGHVSGRNKAERDELETKALEGDTEAQYLLGLYELKQYLSSDEFIDKALNRIKNAAISNNPLAMCFLGLFMREYRKDYHAGDAYLRKALRAFYQQPFPDLPRME